MEIRFLKQLMQSSLYSHWTVSLNILFCIWRSSVNPMKCWKAAIRQWRRRQDDFRPKGEPAAGLPLEEHDERRNNRFDRTKKLLAQARGHDGKGLYE